jgi:hypothetical protein
MTQLQKFLLMLDAIGDNATQEQVDRLLSWTVHNLPKDQWGIAAGCAVSVGEFYTDIRERMAECGVY